MIDELFEMVMKEARSRPGDNIKINGFLVILELSDRLVKAFNIDTKTFLDSLFKDDKPA